MAKCPDNDSGGEHVFGEDGLCKTCAQTYAETLKGFGSNCAPRSSKPRTIKSLSG